MKKIKPKIGLLTLIILIPSLIVNFFLFNKINQSGSELEVIEVFDGDTFKLANQQYIRLMSLDAPELEFCGGQEAKTTLEKLILYKKIALTETVPGSFNRTAALVYVGKKFINLEMIKSGWVRYDGVSSSKTKELKEAGQYARDNKKGVFGKCLQVTNPDNSKCIIKGNIHEGKKDKIYFLSDCRNYKKTLVELDQGDQWFCTEKEAQDAGFRKSQDCPQDTY